MHTTEVTVVRIYTTEGAESVPALLTYLQKEVAIGGITVFRGLSGFGETGTYTNSFLDSSFSLPLVIEFFDCSEKVKTVLEYLDTVLKGEHLICFPAQLKIS